MTDVGAFAAFVIVGSLASIGLIVVIYHIVQGVRLAWDTAVKLNATLYEAVEILKMYKADFTVLRQVQEAVVQQEASPNFGPLQTQPAPKSPPPMYPFPAPPFQMWQQEEAPEPDAAPEDVRQVDVTATEEELVDAEKIEAMAKAGFGRPDPEFKPRAVEVDSE